MQPLTELPDTLGERIRAILFDIDDTITLNGALPARAYLAIEQLHEAGYITIPITGRPAGWCDLIARLWPIDGVVGENGAFYFRHDADRGHMEKSYWYDDTTFRCNREKLDRIAAKILARIPNARLAGDQSYREADLAIDICEDIPPLSTAEVDHILAIFEQHGATAKLSSIHVNGWFGDYDKCSMALRMLKSLWGYTPEQAKQCVMYVGDSPNDAPMFGFFPYSIGVANIHRFADQLTHAPRWVTEQPGGLGFAELADRLLAQQ